jgi:hypothetical protein
MPFGIRDASVIHSNIVLGFFAHPAIKDILSTLTFWF